MERANVEMPLRRRALNVELSNNPESREKDGGETNFVEVDHEPRFVRAVREEVALTNVHVWLDHGRLRGTIPDNVSKADLEMAVEGYMDKKVGEKAVFIFMGLCGAEDKSRL